MPGLVPADSLGLVAYLLFRDLADGQASPVKLEPQVVESVVRLAVRGSRGYPAHLASRDFQERADNKVIAGIQEQKD
jgi:hypothetical protein